MSADLSQALGSALLSRWSLPCVWSGVVIEAAPGRSAFARSVRPTKRQRVHLVRHVVRASRDGADATAVRFLCGGWLDEVEWLDRSTRTDGVICRTCVSRHQGPAVYRAYDRHGDLLYIGSTVHLRGRLSGHERSSTWWSDAVEITTTRYADARAAREAEAVAIVAERPRHNQRGVTWQATTGSATFAVISTVAVFLEAVLLVGLLGIGAR